MSDETCSPAANSATLKRDRWRQLFDKYDQEGFGELNVGDFLQFLKDPDLQKEIPPYKLVLLRARAAESEDGPVDYEEFLAIASGRRFSYGMAIAEGAPARKFVDPAIGVIERALSRAADEFLYTAEDRRRFEQGPVCCAPPILMLACILAQMLFAMWQLLDTTPLDQSLLVFRSSLRNQPWRFVLYWLPEVDWPQLAFSVTVEALLGMPLEMVHGTLRTSSLFFAALLAGSLGSALMDGDALLIGAAPGAHALVAEHLINVLSRPPSDCLLIRLLIPLVPASVNIGLAIFERFSAAPPRSFAGHVMGALTGALLGPCAFRGIHRPLRWRTYFWLALGLYAAFIAAASVVCALGL